MGNPAEKIFELQIKATLEVKTRHFVTTFEEQKTTILRVNKLDSYAFLSHGTFSICRDNLFLSSYVPCSAYFVGNRLLTNDILRLAISILFLSCRGRKPIETSWHFRTQNNSRKSTWNCNFLNYDTKKPYLYTYHFLKDYQRYATAYCTERECHVCVTQNRKCNALQTGS